MRISKTNFSELQLPTHWDPMARDQTFFEVQLNPACSEYRDVEARIRSSAGTSVRQIVRVSGSN
jgi:hypothetical protein